ncbi:uncharacterized protein ASPGLDRAFT_35135 [Aspergillus glaucus CBS 516.65]|uniref:Uncharacterized protein n=1 Tax=Aspergillus glaucus CBS 516.65 TaxID=1160497 RepID=A0A1L9VL86_ASPGL|nr:hypothetical protein ASPGLDRAFT_35135 [Aspergillus glaucus CBS 516.65]OJJ84651.1 hypothetical protein ASPGLDRAFT_35135 [Aspergillus glaucus CBS 516.65]
MRGRNTRARVAFGTQGPSRWGGNILAKVCRWKIAQEQTSVYGAIAVGRYARFYQYNYAQRLVQPLAPGGNENPLCIGRDCYGVQDMLNLIYDDVYQDDDDDEEEEEEDDDDNDDDGQEEEAVEDNDDDDDDDDEEEEPDDSDDED